MMNGLYSHDCRRHGFSQKIIFHLEKGNFKNGIVSRQKPHRFPQFTLKSKHASFQSPQI